MLRLIGSGGASWQRQELNTIGGVTLGVEGSAYDLTEVKWDRHLFISI